MPMQRTEAMPMARSMFQGASLVRIPESWAKKEKKGILIPACSTTPADANSNRIHNHPCPPSRAAAITMDLLTKPLNRGRAEIEAAPTIENEAVRGMDL